MNESKCKFMVFGSSRKINKIDSVHINIYDHTLERTDSFKYLGVIFNENLTCHDHIDYLGKKINQQIDLLKRVRYFLPLEARITLHNSLISPLFDYADIVWGDRNNEVLMNYLQTLQNKACKIILNRSKYSSASEALCILNFNNLSNRRKVHRLVNVYKCINDGIDFNLLQDIFLNESIHSYNTRSKGHFHLPKVRTNWGKQKFTYHALKEFNALPSEIKEKQSTSSFKKALMNYLQMF